MFTYLKPLHRGNGNLLLNFKCKYENGFKKYPHTSCILNTVPLRNLLRFILFFILVQSIGYRTHPPITSHEEVVPIVRILFNSFQMNGFLAMQSQCLLKPFNNYFLTNSVAHQLSSSYLFALDWEMNPLENTFFYDATVKKHFLSCNIRFYYIFFPLQPHKYSTISPSLVVWKEMVNRLESCEISNNIPEKCWYFEIFHFRRGFNVLRCSWYSTWYRHVQNESRFIVEYSLPSALSRQACSNLLNM